jgi:glycosyltransferase involved in cell wall biosynthesis
MKIALVHLRLLRRGGLETRLFSYMRYFSELGHDVSVIVYKIGQDVIVPEHVRLMRINLKRVPKPIRGPVFNRKLKQLISENRFDFTLSLTRTSHQDAVLAPGNHIGFLEAKGKRFRNPLDLLHIHMERKAFSAEGSIILAASHMMKEELVHYYGIAPSKIRVLLPPIDNGRFHQGLKAERSQYRQKYGFDPHKHSFVFISTSHWRKGLPLLLQTFRALENQPFELIVAGVKPVNSSLKNVKYLGFVERTEALYAAADFCILPSVYEPFGQVVAESIFCGTPVLISHMVGAKEIVSEREGRVINSFSPKEWTSAIQSISQQKFAIDPDFGAHKKIRLEDHMDFLLKLAERKRSASYPS